MTTTVSILNGLYHLYPDNLMLSQIKNAISKFPESESAFCDAFSIGQLQSKLWLLDNLPDNLGDVFICAGWYGTLAALMFERSREKFSRIRSFDMDPSCAPIADALNRPWVMDGWQFKASTMNISGMDYPASYATYRGDGTRFDLFEMPDTIINTSCEHIHNFEEWYSKIPEGKIIVLQSNDYFEINEHVNCCDTLKSFEQQTPLTTVLYSGELELPKYKRFMRIGIK